MQTLDHAVAGSPWMIPDFLQEGAGVVTSLPPPTPLPYLEAIPPPRRETAYYYSLLRHKAATLKTYKQPLLIWPEDREFYPRDNLLNLSSHKVNFGASRRDNGDFEVSILWANVQNLSMKVHYMNRSMC